jgi:hypothetical protein
MATCETSVIKAMDMMQAGIDAELERIILARLKENAAPMLEKMAKDMAEGLKANIITYHRLYENDIMIVLQLDGVETFRV